jgi:phage I-like protein
MDPLCSDTHCVASTGAAREGGLDSSPALALCEAVPAPASGVALAVELLADGQVPEWIKLMPAGAEVQTRDDRRWNNPDPAAVIAATRAHGLPLPLDFEHGSEIGPPGQPSPAAGWIEALELREGAIWARAAWTPRAADMLRAREYRFLSPAFLFDKATQRILRITSVALTNRPAFPELALNRLQYQPEDTMTPEQRKTLCAALALADTATDAEIVTAAQKQHTALATAAEQAKTPPLDKFVPRGDYDAQVAKATAAETKLADQAKAEQAKAIDAEISAAVSAKKITPATADYYRAMCAQAGGLEQFKKFIAAAPVLAPDQVIQGDPAKKGAAALTADQLAICKTMGMDTEAFAQARAE